MTRSKFGKGVAVVVALVGIVGSLATIYQVWGKKQALAGPPEGNRSPPSIQSFTASPHEVTAGQSSTLKWSVASASSVSIEPGIGTVSLQGSRQVQPATRVDYKLTARNEWGRTEASCTVSVARLKPLYVRVSQGSPSVNPGQKATIYVSVVDENGKVVPGAQVLVSAGGGRLLPTQNAKYRPLDRQQGPYSASGRTASNGGFTTWWVCQPCAAGYVMSAEASKAGYTDAETSFRVDIR